jgi:predicted DsbA family dithiol-disulfide isomerase
MIAKAIRKGAIMVKLDIISDPICPWCYIGKANLDKALLQFPDHPFVMEWHPFQLNPDMPVGGMDRREYLETKFGGKEAAIKAYAPVATSAEKAGIPINFDAMKVTPNTIDAHRLIHWAGLEERQTFVVDLLFKAYFVEGCDIGSHEVLADIADTAEMNAGVVTRLLATDEDRADVSKRDQHSRQMGVNSVPTFVVANQHAVPGAQPPETWISVIQDIQAQLDAAEQTA